MRHFGKLIPTQVVFTSHHDFEFGEAIPGAGTVVADLYPYIYKYGLHESWNLYFKGGKSPNRWFYSYLTGGFVNEPDLRQ